MFVSLIAVALPGAPAAAGPTTGHPAGAAAAAYPPATNYRTQYLTANPREGMATAEVSRNIYLVSGTYLWTVDIGKPDQCADPWACPSKGDTQIWLVAGSYSWRCYLDPRNGTYVETCTLQTAGYPQASLSSPEFSIASSGDWTWGGFLYRMGN